MKLRIKNDSIRLRLAQDEVEKFAAEGRVEDRIRFGPSDGQCLSYTLSRDAAVSVLGAHLSTNCIDVRLPASDADEWTSSKKVGFEVEQDIGGGRTLTIIVEKDFQRLKPRSAEDVEGKFPHPRADA